MEDINMEDIDLNINCSDTTNKNISTLELPLNLTNNIDETRCMANKNLKSMGIQCPFKRKNGSIFCGRHRNNKVGDTFDKHNLNPEETLQTDKTLLTKKVKLDTKAKLDKKVKTKSITKIITLQDYQDNSELNKYNKKSIRESYHHYHLDYYCENKERNVDIM